MSQEQNELLRNVSKEIILIKFKGSMTLNKCYNEFYNIMRKYGIKQGIPAQNEKGEIVGIMCDNFEWTLCNTLFKDRLSRFYDLNELLNGVPKDLEY